MLDFRIRTFLTLYERMNYRKTAEALNITQPGVTQHIHHLEELYGVKLFTYNGRVLTRTPNAQVLKMHLEAVLAQERAMREQFVGIESPPLHVGATKTIGEFVLPEAVGRYLADPGNTLELTVDNTENLLRLLENARLDFAVVEGIFDKARYPYHLYRKEPFVGVCPAGHPFADTQVPLEAVFRQTLLLREPGSGTRRLLEQAIEDRGFSLGCFCRVVSVSSFSLITSLIASGAGITFAYEPVARSRPGLATFALEDLSIHGEFNFLYCSRQIALPQIARLFPDQG